MSDSSKTAYTREQGNRWLAWLARGMERHNEQVLSIENLQPSWLESARSRLAYIFLSRIGASLLLVVVLVAIWGRWRAATDLDKTLGELTLGMGFGLGLTGGLFISVIDAIMASSNGKGLGNSRIQRVLRVGVSALLLALFFWGTSLLSVFSEADVTKFGIFLVLVSVRGTRPGLVDDIRLQERFPISFRRLLSRWIWWSPLFLLLTATVSYLFLAPMAPYSDLYANVSYAASLLTGLATLVLLVVIYLSSQQVLSTTKSRPNQGVRLTLRRATELALIGGIVGAAGIYFGIRFYRWSYPDLAARASSYAAIWFVYFGLVFFAQFGGLDFLRHWTLRLILTQSVQLPLKLSKFLDFCAERLHFLQRTGGAYLFVHRYLLLHFAHLDEEKD